MHDDYVATLADWVAILSISTRFMFEKVRERAIKEITARLDKVEAFELIRLAIKFDVEQWLKPAYRRIVTRTELIPHAVLSAKIPVHVTIMLTRAREQYWKYQNSNQSRGVQNNVQNLNVQSPNVQNPTVQNPNVRNPNDADAIIEAEIRLMAAEHTESAKE